MKETIIALALVTISAPAGATEAGLDIGQVVSHATVRDHIAAVESTGVGWVRINMRIDDWTAPDDQTRRGPDQLTWFEAYDRVVDAYLARGISVYALINDEAVRSTLDHNTDAWIALYVANAVNIVDHFKSRIRTYEIINEPNDYNGGSSARFTPRSFAKILQDTYLAVKHDAGHVADRCWQVELVSGPLFSFDATPASDYLAQAYSIGRSQLAWDYTHQATGSYPLDGVGYHIYVAQGSDTSLANTRAMTAQNLANVWTVVTANEGAATAKRLWVSEFGFRADWLGEAGQAERMQASFDALAQFGKVALGVYFNFQDFPGAAYGVFDDHGARRPSADMLKALADAHRPEHGARIVDVVMPVLAPGALGDAIVTIENRGTATWTSGFRLGAAPGCPDATITNEVEWAPDPTAGYAKDKLDARVFLPTELAPGASIGVHVPIRAPDRVGVYAFGARMVHEGVTWFGATATATLTVSMAGSGSGSDPGQLENPGGGCSTSGGAGLSIAIAALTVRRRRRRT